MQLSHALRLDVPTSARSGSEIKNEGRSFAFVGSGGKTSAIFLLARQLQNENVKGPSKSVLVTATSHLAVSQIPLADHHIIIASASQNFSEDFLPGVTLVTGPIDGSRTTAIHPVALSWLHDACRQRGIPLLIEADGSRQLPLKAPADHEPSIPDFADTVIVVVGLSGLGNPLDEAHVHRPQIFSELTNTPIATKVTPETLFRELTHPQGGLKNIPSHARRVIMLNQADTPELQSLGGKMARDLLGHFDSVLVGSLHRDNFQTIERCAGIILAAGESKRFGTSKQLLDWNGKPFVRHIAETAMRAGLDPVVVVIGFDSERIASALMGLPVTITKNAFHAQGQSTSIKKGVAALPADVGSAIFLLADQPQIPVEVIRALAEFHSQNLPAILAPLVLEEKRANPVLFDRVTFPDLHSLTGDTGGRAIFDKHKVEYLPWHDDILLFDVDTPADYEQLKGLL